MRPSLLNPLFAAVTTLPGVGPKLETLYARLLDRDDKPRIIDLLFHLPTGVIDRRSRPKLRDATLDTVVTVAVTVDRRRAPPPHRPRAPYQVYTSDETGDLILTFFNARKEYLQKLLPVGERRYASGIIRLYDGMRQMVHPDRIIAEADVAKLPLVEPVYPLTEGLSLNAVSKAVDAALTRIPMLPEWQEPSWVARERYPTFAEALRVLHRPAEPAEVLPEGLAWSRLAYDEFLAGQLALALVRQHVRRPAGRATLGSGQLRKKLIEALPYSLTPSQSRAVADIVADLAKPQRMLRAAPGRRRSRQDGGSAAGRRCRDRRRAPSCAHGADGGSGAPALQHDHAAGCSRQNQRRHSDRRERGRERGTILEQLALGEIHILVGTHALFQEQVEFRDLGLAVVDEQHRFGVHQRLALARKGEAVDVLVMTATPIPRTLVLSYFGDMDVSELRGTSRTPAYRYPHCSAQSDRGCSRSRGPGTECRAPGLLGFVRWWKSRRASISRRRRSVPLALRQRFGAMVDLIHGRMKGAEKDLAMARFASGETRLLVATTVIEVGVDVPEATVMVIEHAERFGLAQLHQLRGRIGRGAERSTCLLLYKPPLGETAKARLRIMRESEDGFRIAEEDLKLRGEETSWGRGNRECRGSVLPGSEHTPSSSARRATMPRCCWRAIQRWRRSAEEALRHLLYIFERDEAIRLLRAG